jgi:hypothetical protein
VADRFVEPGDVLRRDSQRVSGHNPSGSSFSTWK